MVTHEQLAFSILKSLEIAVLKRMGPQSYQFVGEVPPFYANFFSAEDGTPSSSPWEISPMLEFFLEDAETFFQSGVTGSLNSGVWQEDGKTDVDSAMLATAINYEDAQVITIRLLHEDYRQKAGILRKAREKLLESRHLSTTLELFRTKSLYDGLTKVYNRVTFMEILDETLQGVVASRERLGEVPDAPALLMMDIDNFKKVNDTYGHLCGDTVLQTLGALLQKRMRKADVVARYGGEEFIVLITRSTPELAKGLAEKLCESIRTQDFSCIPHITVSIGCTFYIPGESVEDFLSRADKALYAAKTSGKDRVCVIE